MAFRSRILSQITHLQFADGTLVFCGACKEDIVALKGVYGGVRLFLVLKLIIRSVKCWKLVVHAWDYSFCFHVGCEVGSFSSMYLWMPYV